jgi:NAD(P)-dependent dehydrogenase (short-subunit alcohol dehydrogenase family)
MSETPQQKVWFITGTSRGFGHELVRLALERGDQVVATSRDPRGVAANFKHHERLHAIQLDLTVEHQIATQVAGVVRRFGRIDVLVNNAGHGMLGAIEEVSDEDVVRVFETNVFGLLRVTRAVLPQMRQQRSGHIVNLSSISGLTATPGWGIYSATKFAVEGISEALAKEVASLGIQVTIVEPGPFRTDFLSTALPVARQIDDYNETAGRTRAFQLGAHGKQPGDPVRAAEAIVDAVLADDPPRHLLLGTDAYRRALDRLEFLRGEFHKWRDVTLSADLPPEE